MQSPYNSINGDIELSSIKKRKVHEWSNEHEVILVDWADKAMCYKWLHAKANSKYSRHSKYFTIPVIIISTLTGTANFAQDRVPEDYLNLFVMIIGSLNILAGIISTIQQFLKINELKESHRISSISWDKLYRNIKVELAKKPKERENISSYLKKTKEQYDLLIETSPEIRLKEIKKFNNVFKDIEFLRPEICNSLISVRNSVYENNKKEDENLETIENIKEKRQSRINNLEIENFVKNYKIENNREPTVEEIYDNLEDQVNRKYIDLFVKNLKNKIDQERCVNIKIDKNN